MHGRATNSMSMPASNCTLLDPRADRWLRGAQIGAFAGCAAIIGVLFYWFNPSAVDDCSFNVGITVFTIILCVLVAMAPLHPSVRLPVPLPFAGDSRAQ